MSEVLLRFASLGSGSRGNATVVSAGATHILIDCGFSLRELTRRLARLELAPEQIAALLVTHEHSDHAKGVATLARRWQIPLYMTAGTCSMIKGGEALANLQLIRGGSDSNVGAVRVRAVSVPHDACEPVQFVFEYAGRRLGLLTDLGSINPAVVEAFSGCDGLLLEANYDPELLAWGPYPRFLKARVGGRYGHLSNEQAVELLSYLETGRLQHLVLGHLSQKNNCLKRVKAAVAQLQKPLGQVVYACQEQGFGWLDLR